MKLPYRRRMIERVTSKYYREFAKELTGKRVLEIGCGHGFGVGAIRRYLSPKQIIATDLDPKMIDSAKQLSGDPNIVYEVADATRLRYKNNSFSAVFDY
ncbi:class I SAM-dependent methyltransferase, partial [Candidatus Gottesmanbacteria bacterium]|nr:class I SAM-dependent methyltransferase [Candidatus Gottesmanbacteria bacterium]